MSPTNLIRAWLLDPLGLLFLLSLLMLVLLLRRRFSFKLLLGGLVWIGAMVFVSAPRLVNPMLIHYEQQFVEAPECLQSRPLVLLGGGVDSLAKRADQIEHMDKATYVRSVAASRLALKFPNTPVLVAGGALRELSEAQVMGQFLRKMGVADSRIYEEGDSMNTFENARNVKRLIDQREFAEHINLVTSALHMQRAKAVFEKQGLTVCPIATDFQGLYSVPNTAWWPQISAMNKFDLLMHERIAMLVYGITGKR